MTNDLRPAALLVCVLLLTGTASVAAQEGRDPILDPPRADEVERLRRQIARDSRSTIDSLTEVRTETGDVNNRLGVWRYGTRLNLRLSPSAIFTTGVVRSHYLSPNARFNSSAINVFAGLRLPSSDANEGRVEVGLTTFATDAVTINGFAGLDRRLTEHTTLLVSATRANVEESVLSAAGLRPAVGPFAAQLTGLVMENRFSGGLRYQVAAFDVSGEGGFGANQGSNVATNPFRHFRAIGGANLATGAAGDHVTLARASYQFQYFGYDVNRLGFGGASLITRRGDLVGDSSLGGDGVSPVPSSTRAGIGGYFSPSYFFSHSAGFEIMGVAGADVEYRLAGFIGIQRYTGVEQGITNGVSGLAEFPLAGRWSLPVAYRYDKVGPFRQQSMVASLRASF